MLEELGFHKFAGVLSRASAVVGGTATIGRGLKWKANATAAYNRAQALGGGSTSR